MYKKPSEHLIFFIARFSHYYRWMSKLMVSHLPAKMTNAATRTMTPSRPLSLESHPPVVLVEKLSPLLVLDVRLEMTLILLCWEIYRVLWHQLLRPPFSVLLVRVIFIIIYTTIAISYDSLLCGRATTRKGRIHWYLCFSVFDNTFQILVFQYWYYSYLYTSRIGFLIFYRAILKVLFFTVA